MLLKLPPLEGGSFNVRLINMKSNINSMIEEIISEEYGQTLVETSLIYFLIAIAVFLSLQIFGDSLLIYYKDFIEKVTDSTN